MKTLKSNQHGFSAVELILVLVIVALVGVIGWFVYDKNHKTNNNAKTASKTSTQAKSQASDPYAGWKSHCGNEGACFKYPADWNPVTSGPAGPEPGNFRNPQQTLKLVSGKSDSNGALTDPALWYTSKLGSLFSPNDRYKVWGGYLAAIGVYVPQYAVVDASKASSSGLAVGKTKSTTDDTYISYAINGDTHHYSLNVFALSNDGFTNSKADAWFSSNDAKTALLIVQSLYFK